MDNPVNKTRKDVACNVSVPVAENCKDVACNVSVPVAQNRKDVACNVSAVMGQNIKLLRKRRGRTQDDIAFALNMKRSTLSGYENGVACLLYTSPSPRDRTRYRMPSSA